MKISFPLHRHRVLFLTAVVLVATYLAIETIRIALVQIWIASNDIRNLQRAAILDKDNPEIYYREGIFYLFGVGGSSSNPLPLLRKATELNPRIGKYWLGLGRSCFVGHDQACADRSFEEAVRLSPMVPRIEWEAAAYYALTGQSQESFVHLRRVLQLDPEKAPTVFDFTSRAFAPTDVWRNVVVTLPDPRVRCEYLAFLLNQHRLDLAKEYWSDTVSSSPGPPIEAASLYIKGLLQVKQYGEAGKVWRDLLRLGAVRRPSDDKNNLVFNGGFEQPRLDVDFDWNVVPGSYVAVHFSERWTYEGKRALWVDYTAPHNTEEESAYEFVPVDANTQYVLTAYARSDEITSDSGPRLRVLDPMCATCLDAATAMTVANTGWHKLELRFTTGPTTELLRLSVWRPRSRTFPMDITGSFWLDAVSLVALGTVSPNEAMAAMPPAQ